MRIRVYPNCIPRCKVTQKLLDARFENSSILNELDRYSKYFQSLSELLQEGEIIALRKEGTAVDVIGFRGASVEQAFLMRLGKENEQFRKHGNMHLSSKGNGIVFLVDWNVYEEDRGYGTFFLASVIAYLKRKGYRKLIGRIMPADFDHEEKLQHLYKKLGFQITDHGDHRSIFLPLQDVDSNEGALRYDILDWLTVLESLQHTNLAEKLSMTKEQFNRISRHPLFSEELLSSAVEIGKKYLYVGQYGL